MKHDKGVILLIILVSLMACQQEYIYNQFLAIPVDGWHQDSILNYETNVENTSATYDMYISIRHNRTYPYQNLWLFFAEWQGDTLLQCDTIECFLADEFGRWIGNGMTTYQLQFPLAKQQRFQQTGTYQFTIQQAMRTEYLKGIQDVGLTIQYHNEQE